ncbi:MAG: HmuY family protein [Myxococcales bacterium]|nr:HmuY family protein [Myxococcales bacterium]
MSRLSSSTRKLIGSCALLACGCTDISVDKAAENGGQGGSTASAGGSNGGSSTEGGSAGVGSAPREWPGTLARVDVPSDSAFVNLSAAEVTAGDAAPADWDLHFKGVDVYTNSGASGDGLGGAFGPLAWEVYFAGEYPEVPFIFTDEPSGAVGDWYAYDGATHALYSRFHTYGIRSGDDFFKLQVLAYYGEVQGAPVSAVYSVRYAKVEAQHNHPTQAVEGIDATAGWPKVSDSQPSSCLRLSDGAILALTPSEAQQRTDWDVCFRRDNISINGDAGGPGGVTGVDLDADDDADVDQVKLRNAESTLASFDSLDWATLSDPSLKYRGDRVVSAFTDAWLDTSEPPLLADASWLVIDHAGAPFLLAFSQDEPADPGHLTLHLLALD